MHDIRAIFMLEKNNTIKETGDSKVVLNLNRSNLSGGEISRLLLAIKIASTNLEQTIIFDEIDIGVSGLTAHKIGNNLKYVE